MITRCLSCNQLLTTQKISYFVFSWCPECQAFHFLSALDGMWYESGDGDDDDSYTPFLEEVPYGGLLWPAN